VWWYTFFGRLPISSIIDVECVNHFLSRRLPRCSPAPAACLHLNFIVFNLAWCHKPSLIRLWMISSVLFNYFPTTLGVLGMTLNCIHIFIVTGSFLYWCVMRPASQRFFIHSCIYLRILTISYLATFLGTNSLSVLMCRKAVIQSTSPNNVGCRFVS